MERKRKSGRRRVNKREERKDIEQTKQGEAKG